MFVARLDQDGHRTGVECRSDNPAARLCLCRQCRQHDHRDHQPKTQQLPRFRGGLAICHVSQAVICRTHSASLEVQADLASGPALFTKQVVAGYR